jgi:hypothetical protein
MRPRINYERKKSCRIGPGKSAVADVVMKDNDTNFVFVSLLFTQPGPVQ